MTISELYIKYIDESHWILVGWSWQQIVLISGLNRFWAVPMYANVWRLLMLLHIHNHWLWINFIWLLKTNQFQWYICYKSCIKVNFCLFSFLNTFTISQIHLGSYWSWWWIYFVFWLTFFINLCTYINISIGDVLMTHDTTYCIFDYFLVKLFSAPQKNQFLSINKI